MTLKKYESVLVPKRTEKNEGNQLGTDINENHTPEGAQEKTKNIVCKILRPYEGN